MAPKATLFALLAVAAVLGCALAFSNPDEDKPARDNLPSDGSLRVGVLKRVDGCTRKSTGGDKLSMHYTGWTRADGKVFDSSVSRNSPFDFTLGQGMVIKGWDNGLVGMCVGERRRLTIPSGLGYGDNGSPPKIPGGATLVFDVELLDIKNAKSDL